MGEKWMVNQVIVDEVRQQPYLVHDILKTTGREILGNTSSRELYGRMISKGAFLAFV